ncbi:flagellar biosynthesis anti-sigma factor FlgM [Clostridium thailandense]|uniref:Flagellar biosynthesis anti-sigma factor FlgM n=1 Tax=Clostridium thailandense TaxID=2794346 RepID=A0A949TXG6_9CLOT|nr:flagellar biosynthesis anti-sigma factor FlgM [Clostridium thailandense]MBV7272264.1 flagellar biosynthesis anti-sigma factor FlgM [Clostridium thailandense]MCH5137810.1 flagellar biosynthesis anti-sigma factor FlgM [Clostridiaceae bacterium UIB06]
MKINSVDPSKLIKLYSNNVKSVEKKEEIKKSDSIEISSLGKSLSTYSPEDSLVNSKEKVEKIKKEITNGTYKRDAKLVAEKVLENIKKK